MVDQTHAFAGRSDSRGPEVGRKASSCQAEVKGVSGVWKDLTENVHRWQSNLTGRSVHGRVAPPSRRGDLSPATHVDVLGEITAAQKRHITMVDQLKLPSRPNDRVCA